MVGELLSLFTRTQKIVQDLLARASVMLLFLVSTVACH
jgi:hypothetical protein